MNTKNILLLLLLTTFICYCFSSTTTNYLFSVSTPEYKNGKLITIIDLSNGNQVSSVYIDLEYQVINILSIDKTSNTLLLLCGYLQTNYLVSVDINSSKYNILSTADNNFGYEYQEQSFQWIEEQKIAFLPVLVGQFSISAPVSNMVIDFESQKVTVTNYTLDGLANLGELPVQGFDPINQKVYISYSTYNSNTEQFGTNMLSYNYSNFKDSQQTFESIYNVSNIELIFTDSQSNIYLIKQEDYYNGLVDICKLDLISKTCPSFITIQVGSFNQYQFYPFILSQDGSTLLIFNINNQYSSSSSSSGSNGSYDLTLFNINSNFEQTLLKIDNYWPLDQFFSNSFLF